MRAVTELFVSPLTWMIFGGAAQLALAGYVRAPRTGMWGIGPVVMIGCLLGAIPTALDGDPRAFQYGMGYGVLFAAVTVAALAPAAMNEGLLLALTATYWISFIVACEQNWWGGFALIAAGLVALAPTLAILSIVATGSRPGRAARFALYLWALFAFIVVGLLRFPYSDFAALKESGRSWIMILAATYLGAHIAMIVHNVMALFLLIPFPAKDKSYDRRLDEVEAYASSLIDSYSSEPLGWRRAALIVAGQGAFVWLMSLWRPEGAGLAVHACLSLILVGSVFFSRPGEPRKGRKDRKDR